jgi:hypothetical protein
MVLLKFWCCFAKRYKVKKSFTSSKSLYGTDVELANESSLLLGYATSHLAYNLPNDVNLL